MKISVEIMAKMELSAPSAETISLQTNLQGLIETIINICF